jgi:hypothetical protein
MVQRPELHESLSGRSNDGPIEDKQIVMPTPSPTRDLGAEKPEKSLAKSRHPDFRAWTGYLRRDTLIHGDYKLKISRDPRDMSELIECLLSAWIDDQAGSSSK